LFNVTSNTGGKTYLDETIARTNTHTQRYMFLARGLRLADALGARMRVAPAASTRAENTQTHRHTDTQTHSRTRARAPMAQTATEGPPSFSGVNAIKQFWRVRSDLNVTGVVNMRCMLNGWHTERCGCRQRAAASHGEDVGIRRWVGSTGPRGGAASRASTVRNRSSCWAQMLLAAAGLLSTCYAGEESNGTNSPDYSMY